MGFIGDILGGKTSTKTTFSLTPAQSQLIDQQVEIGEFQLEELERQRELQDRLYGDVGRTAGEFEDFSSSFTGAPTPEQQALIDESIARALEQGQSDILAFQSQATEQLREELAPSLGLMPGDTPVLDRGSRIAAESARQQGQLVSGLAGDRAKLSLDYPLEVGDFQARLKENAFRNRLELANVQGSLGLGLAGVATPQVGGALANQASKTETSDPIRGLESTLGLAGGIAGFF